MPERAINSLIDPDGNRLKIGLVTKVEVFAAKPFVNRHRQPRRTKKKKPGMKPGES
jgi:hypothetical protein